MTKRFLEVQALACSETDFGFPIADCEAGRFEIRNPK